MKAKNRTPGYLLFTLLCAVAFFSCKKEVAGHSSRNDLTVAASTLESTKRTGSITVVTEKGESAFVFESAEKLVVIVVPESPSLPSGTMKPAELIVSKYGVVVKDVSQNKVWLQANGDAESKGKFDALSASFPTAHYGATILDLVEINTGKE